MKFILKMTTMNEKDYSDIQNFLSEYNFKYTNINNNQFLLESNYNEIIPKIIESFGEIVITPKNYIFENCPEYTTIEIYNDYRE